MATESLAKVALDHGKVGVQGWFAIEWAPDMPFKNILKLARFWSFSDGSTNYYDRVDRNDNLIYLPTGVTATSYFCKWSFGDLEDFYGADWADWLFLYDGEATFTFGGHKPFTTTTISPGRVAIHFTSKPTPNSYSTLICSAVNASNPPQNLRFIPAVHEGDHEAHPFPSRYLDAWRHVHIFRFMDWQSTNGGKSWSRCEVIPNRTTSWADRRSLDAFTWKSRIAGYGSSDDYYDASVTDRREAVPYEIQIALCNELRCDGWFCMPERATEDFAYQLATLLKETLDPSLRIYLQLSNEVWNMGFSAFWHCADQAYQDGYTAVPAVYGGSCGPDSYDYGASRRWYRDRSVVLFQQFEAVFGDEMDRVVRVLDHQLVNTWYLTTELLASSAALDHFDAISCALYTSGGGTCTGTSDPDVIVQTLYDHQLDYFTQVNALNALCNAKGVAFLMYEGGPEIVNDGTSEGKAVAEQVYLKEKLKDAVRLLLTSYEAVTPFLGPFVLYSSTESRTSATNSWSWLSTAGARWKEAPETEPKYWGLKEHIYADGVLQRPEADVSTDDWTITHGLTAAAAIGSPLVDYDADYSRVTTEVPEPAPLEVQLEAPNYDATWETHTIKYRLSGNQSVVVTLLQTSTVIASWTETAITSAAADFEHVLTGAQAALITDYTDLRLRFAPV